MRPKSLVRRRLRFFSVPLVIQRPLFERPLLYRKPIITELSVILSILISEGVPKNFYVLQGGPQVKDRIALFFATPIF